MENRKIRATIAESGKSSVKEVVSYFKRRYPTVDIKIVTQEAKEMLNDRNIKW